MPEDLTNFRLIVVKRRAIEMAVAGGKSNFDGFRGIARRCFPSAKSDCGYLGAGIEGEARCGHSCGQTKSTVSF